MSNKQQIGSGKYGYIYLVRQSDKSPYYKIGFSTNPAARVSQLEASSPTRFVLIHLIKVSTGVKLERELHRKFASKRARNEWFKLSKEDVDYVKAIESEDVVFPQLEMTDEYKRWLEEQRELEALLKKTSGDMDAYMKQHVPPNSDSVAAITFLNAIQFGISELSDIDKARLQYLMSRRQPKRMWAADTIHQRLEDENLLGDES